MADILVTPALQTVQTLTYRTRQIVWRSSLTGYVFYYNQTATTDKGIWYVKTTDGGQTWSAGVKVNTDLTGRTINGLGVWFDQWTPGNTGSYIYIAWVDTTADVLNFRILDVRTDTFGAQVIALNPDGGASSGGFVDICLAKGGYLYIVYSGACAGNLIQFLQSTNLGASWTAKANFVGYNPPRPVILAPGNEADTNDIYCNRIDSPSNINFCLYDSSANTWSDTALGAGDTWITVQIPLVVEKSTGTVYGAYSRINGANWDFKVFKATNYATITELTDVYTNVHNHSSDIQLSIDLLGNLYAVYVTAASQCWYKKSTDGGLTWSAAVRIDEDGSASLPLCAPGAGGLGGRLFVVWPLADKYYGNDGDVVFQPIGNTKRVGSLRHLYRPGLYNLEITLGGLVRGMNYPDNYKIGEQTFEQKPPEIPGVIKPVYGPSQNELYQGPRQSELIEPSKIYMIGPIAVPVPARTWEQIGAAIQSEQESQRETLGRIVTAPFRAIWNWITGGK
jgi:hypothetical protein